MSQLCPYYHNYVFELWEKIHTTHLKLLDKTCKYEMDLVSIVEDAGRTRFCRQTDWRTDGQTDGRTDKRTRWNQYTSLIIFVEADWGYNIQIVLPLTSDPILMAKNDAHYIYIYIIYIQHRASNKYVKAYNSRRYSCIATVYSWQTETGKPYCNIEFLSNMVIFSKLSPIDKTLFTHSWKWGMGCLLWVQGLW